VVATRARALAAELGQAVVVQRITAWSLLPAAITGDRAECRSIREALRGMDNLPATLGRSRFAAGSLAIADLAERRFSAAWHRLAAAEFPGNAATADFAAEQVEAAAGDAHPERAVMALTRVRARAQHSTQDWIKAVALRCQALVGPEDDSERQYLAALNLHHSGGRPFEQARTRLLYGEWLRRRLRRTDARVQLRPAAEVFAKLGATTWEQRASDELRAATTPDVTTKTDDSVLQRLTVQESQVVKLAAAGYSNREIGARLT
jgi:DNA-binding NarL/FixJ family response regulator